MGVSLSAFTQRHGHYWMFGNGLALDFNCQPPTVSKVGSVNLKKGNASIANACGDLRFYTDGDSIWHYAHFPYNDTVFPLNGSQRATQSSVILPSKTTPGKYYLLTIDDTTSNMYGLSYTEIEMAQTAPGIFPAGKANQVVVTDVNEMIAAIDHENGIDYWVVVKLRNDPEFRAYLVSDALGGLDPNYVPSIAGTSKPESGQMKISPDGRFLAIGRPLQIFTFNNATGEIAPYVDFDGVTWIGSGGSIEFSPSGNRLFFNNYGFTGMLFSQNCILEVNLAETDLDLLKKTVTTTTTPFECKGGMQLGPDGKIYFLEDNPVTTELGVISNPEELGSPVDVQRSAIPLSDKATGYFPTFNQSYFAANKPFYETQICSNDSTAFEINNDAWEEELKGHKIDSVKWVFDDPSSNANNISKKNKPSHFFSTIGCYEVKLTLYSLGDSFVRTKLIRIKEAPSLSLGDGDSTLCQRPRNITLFAETANNPGATYAWYYDTLGAPIGDPEGEPGTNPKHPFDFTSFQKADLTGKYWVKKTWNCCEAWDTLVIYHDSVSPRFIINDNLQCLRDNNFVFTNNSFPTFQPGGTSWDFGPYGKKIGDVVNMTYPTNGAFYPTMNTQSDNGCKATITRIVLVVKHPEARFFLDTNQQCFNGNVFSFRDSSTIEFGQGGLSKWDFDLGDSSNTNLKQFTKSYKKPGIYDIRLVVTSSQDCRDTTTASIKVFEQPIAGFSLNDTSQCLSANDFEFTDTSSSDFDPINSKIWTYGDGSPQEDRTALPTVFNRQYSSVDSFLVTLKVGTGIGCFDTAKRYIYVHGDPYVDFAIDNDEQCLDGNVFNFTDTTFTEKGFVQTRLWNFGDASPINNTGLNKTYGNYGAYTVKLRVITNKGCTDSVAKNILINPMPNAAFTADKTISCFKDHSFTFSANPSFIPVGTINSYTWDFGDGTTDNVKEPLPKIYSKDSIHKIILALVSDKGCIDSAQRFINFYPTPVAVVSVNDDIQCLEENLFTYNAEGTITNGGNIKEFLWQLGDGTVDFGKYPPGKFYVKSDTFTVRLQVTTDNDCVDTTSIQVQTLPSPVANFSVDPTCLFQPSEFKNKSSSTPGFITEWNWNLGDGTLTNDSTPVHTYDNTGNYTVVLSVLSNYGCEATAVKVNEAVVKPLPQAKFNFEKTEFDEKNTTIQFIDSSIDANQWLWDLGLGNLSTLQDPKLLYTDTATLPITLIVSNAKGCYDTLTKNIFVAPDFFFHVPNAFTPNRDPLNPTYGGEGTLYYKEYNLKIFSRWGEMVFEAKSPLEKWDGTFKGEPCDEGQYTYVYRLRDVFGYYHNYKGMLTLFR